MIYQLIGLTWLVLGLNCMSLYSNDTCSDDCDHCMASDACESSCKCSCGHLWYMASGCNFTEEDILMRTNADCEACQQQCSKLQECKFWRTKWDTKDQRPECTLLRRTFSFREVRVGVYRRVHQLIWSTLKTKWPFMTIKLASGAM